MTDGEENDSKEFSSSDIKKLVEELKQNRWTFTYIGTDHDVEKIAISLSINNTIVFEKNEADIKKMFMKEKSARANFSKKTASTKTRHQIILTTQKTTRRKSKNRTANKLLPKINPLKFSIIIWYNPFSIFTSISC